MAANFKAHNTSTNRLATFALACLLVFALFATGCGGGSSSSAYSGGQVTTIAGNGVAAYAGDGGAANSAELKTPFAVWMTTSGKLYVADTGNNVVRVVDLTSGNISTFAGTGTQGYAGDSGPATQALLNAPAGVAADSAGNVYISDTGNQVVRQVSPSGIITTIAGTGQIGHTGDGGLATQATLSSPQGLALDKDGNLLIAESGNHVIRKWIASSGVIQTIAGNGNGGYNGDYFAAASAQLDAPSDVKVGSSGNIYIADTGNHVIRMVDATSNMITTIAGTDNSGSSGDGGPATSATLSAPKGLVLDSNENLYICDGTNNTVRVLIKSSGNIYLYAGTGTASYSGDKGSATAATFNTPIGASIDSNGNIYIADSENNVVRRIAK
ncbi:MAG TPA: hypothetical protein VMU24_00420 [Candidatus Acidoferrales bacterium]|nr:hypothetical protein [Candidatus Acidoferrales bacterium]